MRCDHWQRSNRVAVAVEVREQKPWLVTTVRRETRGHVKRPERLFAQQRESFDRMCRQPARHLPESRPAARAARDSSDSPARRRGASLFRFTGRMSLRPCEGPPPSLASGSNGVY
jgi:hypothetical protein